MAGRPRSFDRDRALATALDAFWRDGFDRTSVARLTGEIGINPPSLYAAFGDKGELFEQAAALYVGTFRRAVEECLARPTARASVDALLRETARVQTAPGTPPGCLVYAEPRLRREREWVRATIAARLAQGRRDGDLPGGADVDALAAFLDAVIAGMSSHARDGAGRAELDAIATAAVAAIPSPPAQAAGRQSPAQAAGRQLPAVAAGSPSAVAPRPRMH